MLRGSRRPRVIYIGEEEEKYYLYTIITTAIFNPKIHVLAAAGYNLLNHLQ